MLTAENRRGKNRDFSVCTSLPTLNSLLIIPVKFAQKAKYLAKFDVKMNANFNFLLQNITPHTIPTHMMNESSKINQSMLALERVFKKLLEK